MSPDVFCYLLFFVVYMHVCMTDADVNVLFIKGLHRTTWNRTSKVATAPSCDWDAPTDV